MAEIRVSATGELKLYDSDDSNYVSFKSGGTVSSNVTWTLPTADGSSGQTLTTDGSGTLSWATASSADPSSADGDSLGTASAEWSDLYLADGGVIYFGNDQDVTLTHDPDDGLFLKSIATGDDNPVLLTLQTGETDLAANDVIGKIAFQAPDEGTGTDAILVSAAIQAVAEGDHSSSSNATRLEFMTGASEAAAEKMTLTSAGILNAGKIGVITDHDLGEGIHIRLGDSSASAQNDADALVIEDTHGSGMSILSGNDDEGKINFGDDGDNDIGGIIYSHNTNSMTLRVNAATGLSIDSAGHVTKPLNPAFRVYQSTGTDYANGHTMYNQNITEVYDVNADMGTNGSFTAPVTGKYLFTASIYDTSAADGREYDMILTTSNRTYRWGQRQEYEADVTGFGGNMKLEGTIIVDMDANDTAHVTSGVNATFTNGANQEHSYYSGILIG